MSKKYYSSDNIRKLNCEYNLVIGKRSNGKTFDAIYRGLEDFIASGYKNQFAYLRRWDEDFSKQRGASMFDSLVYDGNGENRIEKLTGGKYNQVYYFSRRWYLAKFNEDTNKIDKYETPFAYGFSISAMEHDKSTQYPMVKTIIFDEFLTRGMYLKDEPILFLNCVSTIIRNRTDVKIYMLANTVSMWSPYFDLMGLTRIREQKPGTIEIYEFGEAGLRIAVEYCADSEKVEKSKVNNDKYFCFNNPRVKMITEGLWELEIYPHCPIKYKSTDIAFIFFMIFKDDILQCEVINTDGIFCYIHRKSTPIKDEDNDFIYSLNYDPRPNWRRNIAKPVLKIEQRIWELFKMQKIFYQDNTVGEIVRNYFAELGVAL